MMFDKLSRLVVLRYFLCIQLLSGWCLVQAAVKGTDLKTVCIHNVKESSKLNITCGSTDRIEVVSIYYDQRQSTSICTKSKAHIGCGKLFKTGLELNKIRIYRYCSNLLQGCQITIGKLPSSVCTNSRMTPFNFVMIEYRCVPDTDFIELCGDADVNITSHVKHLANFIKNNEDSFQNCTCSIQGPHTLTAVDVSVPSWTRICKPLNVWLNLVHTDLSTTLVNIPETEQQLINVDFNELRTSHIRLIMECRSVTAHAWFKIKPVKDSTVRIQCGQSIQTTSDVTPVASNSRGFVAGDTSTPSLNKKRPTETTETYEKDTVPTKEENQQIPVIVGSVIAGAALIVMIISVGGLFYRRYQNLSRPNGSTNPTTNETEYDDACEERIPSYISITNDSEGDERQGNGEIGNVLQESNSCEYETVDTTEVGPNHEYENARNDVKRIRLENAKNHMQATNNTYEDASDIGGIHMYMNERAEDTDYQYSTLGQNVDNTVDYEQLKL